MTPLSVVYATDEDIALRASADFALLCPRDQKLAAGSDGVFDPSDRWTLRSASVDFAAQGLAPGHVVQLTGPASAFRPPGETLVVSSVAPGAIRLRRKGQLDGVGQPPAPIDGLSGIEFLVVTLGPQIERASDDLNRRYGIDEGMTGHCPTDLADTRALREATVLSVLHRRYLEMSREAGGQPDVFATKGQLVKAELDDLLARVVVHWGAALATDRFSTRLSR